LTNLKLIIIALTIIIASVTASASTGHSNRLSLLYTDTTPHSTGKPIKIYVAGFDNPGSLQSSLISGKYLVIPFIDTNIINSIEGSDLILINMDSSWANENVTIPIIEMLEKPLEKGSTIIFLSYKGLRAEKLSRIFTILLNEKMEETTQTFRPGMYYYVVALRLAENGKPLIYTMYASNYDAISYKSVNDFAVELIESS